MRNEILSFEKKQKSVSNEFVILFNMFLLHFIGFNVFHFQNECNYSFL